MIAISSRSAAASSARPPLSYNSTDSWRCLIIFWNTPRRSASLSGGFPSPRAAMSAFLMVEFTIRSVESLRSSLARIASLTALLMSSRSIDRVLANSQGTDLGRSRRQNNSVPQPFDQSVRGRLRLLRLRQGGAMRNDREFGAVNAVRHLLRQRIRDGVVLLAGQCQGRTGDESQRRPRVRPVHDGGLLADEGLGADIVAHVMHQLAQGAVLAAR